MLLSNSTFHKIHVNHTLKLKAFLFQLCYSSIAVRQEGFIMLLYEIPFDTNTTMKDKLKDSADDHNKSLEKLKDVSERDSTNDEAWELPDRTPP